MKVRSPELNQLKVYVAVITEAKKKVEGFENLSKFVHFDNGVPKQKRVKPAASLVKHQKIKKYITPWKPINEKIIKMNKCGK